MNFNILSGIEQEEKGKRGRESGKYIGKGFVVPILGIIGWYCNQSGGLLSFFMATVLPCGLLYERIIFVGQQPKPIESYDGNF